MVLKPDMPKDKWAKHSKHTFETTTCKSYPIAMQDWCILQSAITWIEVPEREKIPHRTLRFFNGTSSFPISNKNVQMVGFWFSCLEFCVLAIQPTPWSPTPRVVGIAWIPYRHLIFSCCWRFVQLAPFQLEPHLPGLQGAPRWPGFSLLSVGNVPFQPMRFSVFFFSFGWCDVILWNQVELIIFAYVLWWLGSNCP